MIKRVNSTGRKRIANDRIRIVVLDGDPRTFEAELDLEGLNVPEDAAVVLEAACAGSNTIPRFEWGTVGQLQPAVDRSLRGLAGRNVYFTLKVIDRSDQFGRILGLAEVVRPIRGGEQTETKRRGLLPVESADLGNEVWKLSFDHGDDVYLLVNEKLPEIRDRMRTDGVMFSLIYSAALRQILPRAIQEEIDEDGAEEHWASLWLQFGKQLHPEEQAAPNRDDDDDSINAWVDDVVGQFCQQQQMLKRFQCLDPHDHREDT